MVGSRIRRGGDAFSRPKKVWLSLGSQAFLGLLLAASGLWGCRDKAAPALSVAPLPPVRGLRTLLLDTVSRLPAGQIAWSTYWRLCWDPYPGAQAYELQTSTAEGTSHKLRRLTEPCYRLQVAAGQNPVSQGFLNRQQLLDLQVGQLSFKVRAVLGSAAFSAWSAPILLDADSQVARSQ